MRHTRLRLVVPDDSAPTAAVGTTDVPEAPSMLRPGARLRLVDADEGTPPDDAA